MGNIIFSKLREKCNKIVFWDSVSNPVFAESDSILYLRKRLQILTSLIEKNYK